MLWSLQLHGLDEKQVERQQPWKVGSIKLLQGKCKKYYYMQRAEYSWDPYEGKVCELRNNFVVIAEPIIAIIN